MFRCIRWNGERIWERYGLLYSKHYALNVENIGIKYKRQETGDEVAERVEERNMERALGKATLSRPGRARVPSPTWRAASNAWFRFDEPQLL